MKVKRRVDLLVERTDRLFRQTQVGGQDADAAWEAIRKLHMSGSCLVFERARFWCSSQKAFRRSRAASILAQLHRPRRTRSEQWDSGLLWRGESFDLICAMLRVEEDTQAIGSEIAALGHIRNPEAVSLIVPFAKHQDANIRFQLAWALGNFDLIPEAQVCLQRLMEDHDREVRDWATFEVGTQGDLDTPQLREAFLARLNDPYFEVRCEAAAGLAKRHDLRVVAPLIHMFERCLYMPIALTRAAEWLLEEDCNTRYWDAKDFVTALRSAYPDEAAWTAPE